MFPTARGCSALCTAGEKFFIAASGSIDPETLSGEGYDTALQVYVLCPEDISDHCQGKLEAEPI